QASSNATRGARPGAGRKPKPVGRFAHVDVFDVGRIAAGVGIAWRVVPRRANDLAQDRWASRRHHRRGAHFDLAKPGSSTEAIGPPTNCNSAIPQRSKAERQSLLQRCAHNRKVLAGAPIVLRNRYLVTLQLLSHTRKV